MYKSQYDNDVTTWSPAGRLHQLEYACSAVDQGSVVLGLRSNTHAVLVGLRRSPSDLAEHQEKLFKIDKHMAIGVSGLISDGRRLCKYMMQETLNYRHKNNWQKKKTKREGQGMDRIFILLFGLIYVFNKDMPIQRLVIQVADKMQVQTQISSGRPYGAGLLVIGYDEVGPHLFETDPAGQYFEYWGHSIGARNQAAKTYLEKHFEVLQTRKEASFFFFLLQYFSFFKIFFNTQSFPGVTAEQLIQHGVQALKETVRTKNLKLTTENTSVMVVGKGTELRHLKDEELEKYVKVVEGDEDSQTQPSDQKNESSNKGNDPSLVLFDDFISCLKFKLLLQFFYYNKHVKKSVNFVFHYHNTNKKVFKTMQQFQLKNIQFLK
ncbi:hypothetical protein RFI_06721 [Reticulomyxa filosa]|uniref:Proteasome alpha-type subunits domain-containing protein n=1 Tax=Reticulomyxa filosa TaxID=46433 RepID=X6NX14_RETFI|nr:hypothetical protein RFI_06721 [Reticulomyxa filosa]|eukprot:ETO30398.1 hypothetical protein RFI_06721 [Reticulomyxa filosa]